MHNQYKEALCHWPAEDRPREKLARYGETHLTNAELLAIILRTGSKGESALALARRLLNHFESFRGMSHTDNREWKNFKGLGPVKIAQIKAALEIGRRWRDESRKELKLTIRCAYDLAKELIPHMRDLKVEVFKVAFLNAQNQVIQIVDIAQGTVNQANPIVREICHKALQLFAVSFICVHNHPSGNTRPSLEDKNFTLTITRAAQTLGLRCLDHIIIGNDSFYSFADDGAMRSHETL